jgi:hypothetical protein
MATSKTPMQRPAPAPVKPISAKQSAQNQMAALLRTPKKKAK